MDGMKLFAFVARREREIRSASIIAVLLLALVRISDGNISIIGYTVTGCLLVGLLAVTENDPHAHRF
jgi:hypothetical protein